MIKKTLFIQKFQPTLNNDERSRPLSVARQRLMNKEEGDGRAENIKYKFHFAPKLPSIRIN